MTGPVYLTGASRSGKTLLRHVLSSHPGIWLTPRTDLWTRFDGRFGDLADDGNARRCVEAILARKHLAALHLDPDRILAELGAGARTYGRLFEIVLRDAARAAGRRRGGEQSEGLDRCAPAVLRAHPDARIVHVVRDPRDRYEAVVTRDGRAPGRLWRTTAQWCASAERAERNARRHPGRYTVVRYEDLVADPATTVQALCDFLGEDYEPAMLAVPDARRYDGLRTGPGATPISGRFAGRGRALPPREVAFIQCAARRPMRTLGYEPRPVRLGWRDRVAHAATTPIAVIARTPGAARDVLASGPTRRREVAA